MSTGSALGYFVEGSSTFYTVSTTVGITSNLALGQDGQLYFAHGTPGSTPGDIYAYNFLEPSIIQITSPFPFVFGATKITGATISAVQNGSYLFGGHVPGEDISSFPVAPSTIAFQINGAYVAPPSAITVYNCRPITLTRVSKYYKYRLRIIRSDYVMIDSYNSGIKQGMLPDTIDIRNLCSLGGSGDCDFLSTATGNYDVIVEYYDACGSNPVKTTIIRLNILPTISSLPITVNGQGGDTADILLCDGSTNLTLTATPDQVMKAYKIKLEKGNLSGGVFTGDGTSDSTSLTPAASVNNINLFSIGGGYLNGHNGYVRAIVSVDDTCSNTFKDTLVFRLSQLRTPDSVSYTVNGYGYDPAPLTIPLCEDTLNLMAQAAGNYDSFIIVLERGTLDPNTDAFIPDPNIDPKADTLEANAIPVNLVQHFPTYLKPAGVMYYDALRVSVMASGPCGVSTAVVHTYMLEKATPASNLSYTLNGINNGTDPVEVLLCGEEDTLTINPNADGTITGYHILLEKGTWDAGVFTDSGSLDSASIAVDDFPLDLAAQFSAYLYPDDTIYRGDLRVTVTTQGPCLPPAQRTQVYRIRHGEPITDLDFTVNDTFQLAELSPAPEVWMCNDTSLTLRTSQLGTIGDNVTVKVEKGTFNTTTGFEGLIGGSGLTRTIPYNDSIELYDISGFKSYLGGNPGIIQVTITLEGPCTPVPVSKAQVFDVHGAKTLIDFTLVGPLGCQQDRDTTGVLPYLAQPVTPPAPCIDGWLGAGTAGIYSYDLESTISIDSFNILVVNESQSVTIVDYTATGSFPYYSSFNYLALLGNGIGYGYFGDEYPGIANSDLFKVTVSIFTEKCGKQSSFSFFKIIDGGMPGRYFRQTKVDEPKTMSWFRSYPNPADNLLYFEWDMPGENKSSLTIYDALGKVMKTQLLPGRGKEGIDISQLPPGVYQFSFRIGEIVRNGKFVKI